MFRSMSVAGLPGALLAVYLPAFADTEPAALDLSDRGPGSTAHVAAPASPEAELDVTYVYTLSGSLDAASYDEAIAAVTLQGTTNQDAPRLYVMTETWVRPQRW